MAATLTNEFNYEVEYQESALPNYLRLSPVGCHVTIPAAFLRYQGDLEAGIDASEIQDPISYYNRTHKGDRVCTVCRIWFFIGETIGTRQYDSYVDFSRRPQPPPPGPGRCPQAIEDMQRRRSACGPICNKVLKKPDDKKRTQRICQDVMRGSCSLFRRLLFQKPVMCRTPQMMNIHVEAGSNIEWSAGLKVVFRDDGEQTVMDNHPRSGGQQEPYIQVSLQPAAKIGEPADPHLGTPLPNSMTFDGPVSQLDLSDALNLVP
ncbi:hypothetical protein B2J93_8 [Marssonina coronariae]|uniref:Uncharacterized protein n=1 Tax=Diplocarpon coronariae TaxID=2795749 RepID=A0A218ZF84_9HELO|nr:hypothetical protein B2J93_8 [Marssonina coronariae]